MVCNVSVQGIQYMWAILDIYKCRLACGLEEGEIVREAIHPKYGEAQVRCACGETFTTGSTKPKLSVEICSKCHPFFTGKQKFIDTGGRVDKFNKKYGLTNN